MLSDKNRRHEGSSQSASTYQRLGTKGNYTHPLYCLEDNENRDEDEENPICKARQSFNAPVSTSNRVCIYGHDRKPASKKETMYP